MSQINQGLYDTFVSPVVKAMSNEASAAAAAADEPGAVQRWMLSDLNPWMLWVKAMAETVRDNRQPGRSRTIRSCKLEREVSKQIEDALDSYRDARDELIERMFKAIYESPWLAAAVGVAAEDAGPPRRPRRRPGSWRSSSGSSGRRSRRSIEQRDAARRLGAAAHLRPAARASAADERPFNLFRRMIEEMKPESRPSLAALKAAIKRQAFALALDEERALAALPKLAPDMDQRRRGLRRRADGDERARRADARAARALSPRRERPRARRRRGGAS